MNDFSKYIPWVISLLSLLIAYFTFLRNGKKDDLETAQKEETRLDGIREGLLKANMKLDQVCTTTTETRSDIKSLNKDIVALDRRMTIVETDVKTAFERIDELKKVSK